MNLWNMKIGTKNYQNKNYQKTYQTLTSFVEKKKNNNNNASVLGC